MHSNRLHLQQNFKIASNFNQRKEEIRGICEQFVVGLLEEFKRRRQLITSIEIIDRDLAPKVNVL